MLGMIAKTWDIIVVDSDVLVKNGFVEIVTSCLNINKGWVILDLWLKTPKLILQLIVLKIWWSGYFFLIVEGNLKFVLLK
jgi:hypothetical protein